MFTQLALGTLLLLASIAIAGGSFWLMEAALLKLRPWLVRRPHTPKLILTLCVAAVWILAQLTAGVWLWAVAFMTLDIFPTLEESVYFALVAFTTLGFGDVLLPVEWRLMAGLAAANGLLNIGFVTAMLIESLRQIRLHQRDMVEAVD